MSSDSEDDCYGNIAQKLQSIKNRYEEDKIKTINLLDSSQPELSPESNKVIEITDNGPSNTSKALVDDSDCEISLDTIIAQNTKKKTTRGRGKRNFDNSDISQDNIISTRTRKKSRTSKAIDFDSSQNGSDLSTVESDNSVNTSRSRDRGRKGRGKITNKTSTRNVTTTKTTVNNMNTTNTPAVSTSSSITTRNSSRSNQRGTRSNNRRSQREIVQQLLSGMFGLGGRSFPTYSVGNTDEYPDECYNQPLFTNQPKTDDVMVVDENEQDFNDSLDENEELSVKVYWQSRECVKFTLRRFQKLQPIFDFFAKRENVSHDKLFFSYNDKILKMEDTPDAIMYSIAKFIDGGIVNQSMSNIVQNDTKVKDGIKLKFQCQNVKKPYELFIRAEDKLVVAMMRCAEHLEKPFEKLKFVFDGDTISGKNTPKELDLEGGECIDVIIIN